MVNLIPYKRGPYRTGRYGPGSETGNAAGVGQGCPTETRVSHYRHNARSRNNLDDTLQLYRNVTVVPIRYTRRRRVAQRRGRIAPGRAGSRRDVYVKVACPPRHRPPFAGASEAGDPSCTPVLTRGRYVPDPSCIRVGTRSLRNVRAV